MLWDSRGQKVNCITSGTKGRNGVFHLGHFTCRNRNFFQLYSVRLSAINEYERVVCQGGSLTTRIRGSFMCLNNALEVCNE